MYKIEDRVTLVRLDAHGGVTYKIGKSARIVSINSCSHYPYDGQACYHISFDEGGSYVVGSQCIVPEGGEVVSINAPWLKIPDLPAPEPVTTRTPGDGYTYMPVDYRTAYGTSAF